MHVFLGRYTRSATGVDGQCRLETESIPPVPRPCPHVRSSIGFTDSSNPFYLFSKLNMRLLLWAPFAPTVREEYPLLIALRGGLVDAHAKNLNR